MDALAEATIAEWKDRINKMSQAEMASLRRFAPIGHLVFDQQYPLCKYFEQRFSDLGGMTPQISKQIGWD